MKADLHIHSCHSDDGELGIPEILEICREQGIRLFSVTDHNGVNGAREAARLCAPLQDLNFVAGIEIDCNFKGTDLHLLGYGVGLNGDDFDTLQTTVRRRSLDAVPQMIRNLELLGIFVDREELMRRSGGEPPTGELFAELLLENPDQRSNPRLLPYFPGGERSEMPLINFYLDFFAQGKPAYVKIEHLDFKEAVALVRDNGGIPIVAHPGLNLKGREGMVGKLLDLGAAGLEVFNNYHQKQQMVYFAGVITGRGAVMTCGSDFHGYTKPRIKIGQYRFLEEFKEYLDQSVSAISGRTRNNEPQ
jgi:3',5'-nucleoside bisphosphate phosphatase